MLRSLTRRAALAALIATAFSGFGFAGSPDEEITVTIAQDGARETVLVQGIEIGETRQLAAESGKPVIVTRTDKGLQIDIDGDITEVALGAHMPHGAHGPHADGAGAVHRKIVRIDGAAPGEAKEVHKIVVMHEGEVETEVLAGPDALPHDGEGKQVIVRRRLVGGEAGG